MADFNVSEAEVLMLEIVDPDIQKTFEEATSGWNLVLKGEAKFVNSRGVRLVTHVEPNPAMKWFEEGGDLPEGDTSRKVDMRVFFTRFAISGTLTGDAIDCTSRESLLDGLSSRVSEDTATALKEHNEQFYEDGKGVKAKLDSTYVFGTHGASPPLAAPFGGRRLRRRGNYNLYSTAGVKRTAGATNLVLNSIASGFNTATFATFPTDAIQGDVLVYKDSYNRAIHGLPYHVNNDTGYYQGQSRSTYSTLQGVVIDTSSARLSQMKLDELEYKVLYKTGVDKDTSDFVMLSSPTQAHAYKLLGYSLKRYTADQRKLDLGYDMIEHNGHPWVLDTDCPDDDLYMLRTKTFGKYQLKALGLMKLNGQLLQPIPGSSNNWKDKYTYYIGGKMDLGCKDPRMNGRLKNLSRSNLAVGIG